MTLYKIIDNQILIKFSPREIVSKQAMITLRGMAEHKFSNVYNKLMRIELNIRGLAIGDCRLAADECRLP